MKRLLVCLLLVGVVGCGSDALRKRAEADKGHASTERGDRDSSVTLTSFHLARQPNILFCISDDQSYAHAGANGEPQIKTPAFDRIAREGIRFTNAFCDAPTCGPSRSAILTGQHIWRLEEAGNIHSTLPAKFSTYTELLGQAGYAVGFTGKGWSPGRLEPGGRTVNPAGAGFNSRRIQPPFKGMANKDYAGNFDDFLAQVSKGQPFCFWLGTHEPHRGYEQGAGQRTGKDPAKVIVPPIFPDHPVVRNDLLDYFVEIEHFDKMVAAAIQTLEEAGQLDNTIIVITSDHGMPFPRAKASLYDAGTHVPLAIRWPRGISAPGRVHESLVNLSTLAPTFLVAAGLNVPEMMTAGHLVDVFRNKGKPDQRLSKDTSAAFIAMERHDGCREGGKGYPCRAVRTREYLYIRKCADFDMIDENLEGFFSAARIGDVANGEEFIPPRKCCCQFPEGVSLDVTQGDMEIDKLWVVRRCGNGDVLLTDHLREIGVVAGMGTENQTQASVFIGLHRRSPGPDANTHDPFIGKEAVQVHF